MGHFHDKRFDTSWRYQVAPGMETIRFLSRQHDCMGTGMSKRRNKFYAREGKGDGVMREIRFRAWDKKSKLINPVVGMDFIDHTAFVGISKLQYGDYELMQYTGLKDKNGKEIYEGDILKGVQGNFVVVEETGAYWIDFKKRLLLLATFLEMSGDKEIIGNIYENPTLLKES